MFILKIVKYFVWLFLDTAFSGPARFPRTAELIKRPDYWFVSAAESGLAVVGDRRGVKLRGPYRRAPGEGVHGRGRIDLVLAGLRGGQVLLDDRRGYLGWSAFVNVLHARIREMVGTHFLRFAGRCEEDGGTKTEEDHGDGSSTAHPVVRRRENPWPDFRLTISAALPRFSISVDSKEFNFASSRLESALAGSVGKC